MKNRTPWSVVKSAGVLGRWAKTGERTPCGPEAGAGPGRPGGKPGSFREEKGEGTRPVRCLPELFVTALVGALALLQACADDALVEPTAVEEGASDLEALLAVGSEAAASTGSAAWGCVADGHCELDGITANACGNGADYDEATGECNCASWETLNEDGKCELDEDDGGGDDDGGEGGGGDGEEGGGGEGGGGGDDGDDDGDDDDEEEKEDEEEEEFVVELTCDPTRPVRGGSVNCEPTVTNSSGSVSYSWAFTPSDGSLPVVNADDGSKWSGALVVAGQVVVTVKDKVNTASDSVSVGVRNRRWGTSFDRADGFTFPGPPIFSGSTFLGENRSARTGSLSYFDVLENAGKSVVVEVDDGPNKGYWYVESETYAVDRKEYVNIRLTPNGQVEIPVGKAKVNAWTYLIGLGFNPQLTLDGTMRHEGLGGAPGPNGKGHSGQMRKANTANACGDAAALVEPIVRGTESDVENKVGEVEENAETAFAWATNHHFVHGNFQPMTAPIVYFNPADTTIAPQAYYVEDAAGNDSEPPRPPECDWSNF